VPLGQRRLHDVTADEAGPAGDQDPHLRSLPAGDDAACGRALDWKMVSSSVHS